uniref:Uncharacterized protein n=1 Tax=Globodera rostochiensis TaxID=31243 RepID=A0A914IGP2_GLORO
MLFTHKSGRSVHLFTSNSRFGRIHDVSLGSNAKSANQIYESMRGMCAVSKKKKVIGRRDRGAANKWTKFPIAIK